LLFRTSRYFVSTVNYFPASVKIYYNSDTKKIGRFTMRLPPFNPKIAVAAGTGAVSVSAVLVKLAGDVPASIIANYRLFFAVLVMIPFIVFHYRKEIRQLTAKNWARLFFGGLLISAHFILWYASLDYTSVASSSVLIALHPILGLLVSALIFKERFSAGAGISIAIAILGSAIILIGDRLQNGGSFQGDMLALGSMAVLAFYYRTGKKMRKSLSLLSYTFAVYAAGTVILLLYNMMTQDNLIIFSSRQWTIFLALAIIPTFFGHMLFNWALKWTKTPAVSIGMMLEPAGAAFLAYFILGEQITGAQWLGGTVILFGLFLFIMSIARKQEVTISRRM